MTKEKAMESLQNTKVYVAGKSKKIQEKLFKLGFTWTDGSKVICEASAPFLFIRNARISCSYDMESFSDHDHNEISADYILGLTWDEKPKHEFKPFDKVLVRDVKCEEWKAALYSHMDDSKSYPYCCSGIYYNCCIPYEGNEELVGTRNKPKEK